ncbi:hypothetical protein EJ02DRAFT_358485 [Clathrospora elynae]|uniref:BTB domain-containing protein n=1 Tax=Clathrospora elynae TaxID=706981 RepID=A0A6A5S810_9PLEO|nr:hypothetical protein EJ02DRAFT_358485 [Clathrospora elynae]
MAHGSIGDVPAATYAEYVDGPFPHHPEAAGASQTSAEAEDVFIEGAPAAVAPQCLALRPALTHRLYSHRLHVRAKAKLQRDRLLSGPMIDVYVGAAKRRWSLHRNLLCHHSEALENELLGDDSGHTRKDRLDLPDHDPAGFELLVQWLYQGRLDDVADLPDASQQYDYAVRCHALYLLCARFDMAQLKNVAMDQYRRGLHQAELVPDADEIDAIYRNSPPGSPFRQLMTRIAARQIMDPASERDVETYRECFEHNADFAIDLVKAIRLGTGGMLFADPTAAGHECEYHDHEAGPNCPVQGKGKGKQAKKKVARSSARSAPSTSSAPQSLPPRPRPLKTPRPPAHRPASSTVGTSSEMAVVTQLPSPDAARERERERDRERLRRVTTPEKRRPEQPHTNGTKTMKLRPVPGERLQSSGGTPHPPRDSAREANGEDAGTAKTLQRTLSRHGIWDWTGRLNTIGRIPHPESKGPTGSHQVIQNGAFHIGTILETQDDFSIPSTTATEPQSQQECDAAIAAKLERLRISHASLVMSPSFSQTKRSSDELVAASSTASTPANLMPTEGWTDGEISTPLDTSKDSPPSTPDTPTPLQRRRDTPTETETTPTKDAPNKDAADMSIPDSKNVPTNATSAKTDAVPMNITSPKAIPTYRIALASNLLSPTQIGTMSTTQQRT